MAILWLPVGPALIMLNVGTTGYAPKGGCVAPLKDDAYFDRQYRESMEREREYRFQRALQRDADERKVWLKRLFMGGEA